MPYVPTHRPPSPAVLDRIQRAERRSALEDAGRYVQAKAAIYPPKPAGSTYDRTGTLGRSITVGEVHDDGTTGYVEVGTNLHYGPYVEYGTGVYGPKGVPITPKVAKFLAWKTNKGKWVRAKSVRGMQPWHYMQKAFEDPATEAYLKARFEQCLARIAAAIGTAT